MNKTSLTLGMAASYVHAACLVYIDGLSLGIDCIFSGKVTGQEFGFTFLNNSRDLCS